MNRIFISGQVKGKQRPQINIATRRLFTPKQTKEYEKRVAALYKYGDNEFFCEDKAVDVTIIAYMLIPKSYSKTKVKNILEKWLKPLKKPDIDNVSKIILDGLNGVAYADDKQVTHLDARKRYVENEEKAGVTVILREDKEI